MGTGKTPGRVSWTARNLALAGPGENPADTLARLDAAWDYLTLGQQEAEEAGARAVLGGCRTCDGNGTLTVPDSDGESASEQACPDPVHAGAGAPAGEPLTHFFHCWRFPAHHACAVALIERQGEENTREICRAGVTERALREIEHAIEDAATGTDAEVAQTAGAVLAIARRALNGTRRQPAGAAPQPEPRTVKLDPALLHQEARRLYAALERLASDEWLGTQGYDGDELQRRVEFARDKLDAAPQGVPGLGN